MGDGGVLDVVLLGEISLPRMVLSCTLYATDALLAQLVEQLPLKETVQGSSP